MFEQQIERARRLILEPKAEWEAIDGESLDLSALYKDWIMPLAAIPAIAGFIGTSILGTQVMGMYYRVPFFSGLFNALISFVLSLGGIYIFAFVLSAIAPYFGAQKNFNQAFKLSAYAWVASWLGGVFLAIPVLSFLAALAGLYSIYLLFLGLPVLMGPDREKEVSYTIVAVLLALIINFMLGLMVQSLRPRQITTSHRQAQSEKVLEDQSTAISEAARNGDLGGMLAAMSGGSAKVITDLAAFEELAPARLAGMKRVSVDVKAQDTPIKMVTLHAIYEGSGGRQIELNIANSPGMNLLKTVAGLSGAKRMVKKDDGSFESLEKEKDRLVMQKWETSTAKGSVAWNYQNFIIAVKGENVPLKALKKASQAISPSSLEKLLDK